MSANIKTSAFVLAVAVDGHGDLAVAYYDFSADRPASRFLATQYWITFSANQGRTWSARQQVTSRLLRWRQFAPTNSRILFDDGPTATWTAGPDATSVDVAGQLHVTSCFY